MSNRREFITLLGAATALPLAAGAQQGDRMRRVGVLSNPGADDAEMQSRTAAFVQGLQELGWTVGRNLRIDYRWSNGDAERLRSHALELVALEPDVVLATSGVSIMPLLQANRSVPIVFAQTIDPVGLGVVESLSRPGGNITGFTQFEYSIPAKWLELLKEIAPATMRAAVLRDPFDPAGVGQWAAMQSVASVFAVELRVVNVRDKDAIESGIARIAELSNAGLIITASAPANVHRDLILRLAERHRLPAVYPYRYFVAAGGLACYGPDTIGQYRRAAAYVDRILRGEKAAELPVQAPTKYELVINHKAAKALGLTVPDSLLATGITTLNTEITPKRVEVLRELVPTANIMAVLVNPTNNPANVELELRQAEVAANTLGLQTIHVLQARTEPDLDGVFSTLIQQRANGLVITADTLFSGKSAELAALASRYAVPTISPYREFVTAGGLMSYGGSVNELYRLVGIYTGRVLGGQKPADLPVQQVTKVELVINLRTAKALGLTVPPTLLARADEVIE